MLISVGLGTLLAPLNSTMLAVALPDIRADFGVGHAVIGWLVSAYLIAMAVAQPAGGRLGDQLGRVRVFRAGLVLFLVLSLLAAAAPGFELLVLLRTGQAVVGAAIMPTGMAMVRDAAPPGRLGRANGSLGALMAISAAVGPLVGAGLLTLGSWRLLFLVNAVPVALALGALFWLRAAGPQATVEERRARLDWQGAALFVAVLVLLTILLNSLRNPPPAALVALAGGGFGAFLVLFVIRQRLAAVPVVGWELFRQRTFAAATAYVLLTNLVMYTTLLALPFFVREVQGRSIGSVGLMLGVLSALMAVAAPVGGWLADTRGRRAPAMLGAVLAVGGAIYLTAVLSEGQSLGVMAGGVALMGAGVGLGTGAATTAAIEAAPRALSGSSAGTNSMMRYLGSIVGAGILSGLLSTEAATPEVGMFRVLFILVAVMAVAALVAARFIHRFVDEEERPAAFEAADRLIVRGPVRDAES